MTDKQHRNALNSLRNLCRTWEGFKVDNFTTEREMRIYHNCAWLIRIRLKEWPKLKKKALEEMV